MSNTAHAIETDTETANTESDAAEQDSATTDAAGPKVDDSVGGRVADAPDDTRTPKRRLSISVSVRGLLVAALITALTGVTATFAWLYIDARSELNAHARELANGAHAEKIALNYAVDAAAMNFQDLNAWKVKLVADTSPELKDKLTKAATSMEQILVPLQWTSTAQPLTAKVQSTTGGAYVVDCFVSVQTKTVQAPDPLQSTATYSVTVDSHKNWQITDVGGIGAATGH
jgi:Mce-associated membrane protein